MQRKATIRHNAARLACVLLAFLTFALPSAATPAATARLPSVSARGAVLYDASEGGAGVLWEKNAHERMPMASTTKIMTALVAIESLPLTTAIQIPAAAVGVEGSSVYLREGEKQTLEALLYAMMLESANDAATAIAIAVAGSVEAFAELMNRRAADMGLGDTHFVNPHGLDAPEHFTSAYDLALIASEALKNPELRKIAGTYRSSMPLGDESGARLLINHNRLLRSYPGAIGGKTGFTKKSGRCLVSAAERDGLRLVAVTLSAPDDWKDHECLLDYGFAGFENIVLADANELEYAVSVSGGEQGTVLAANTSAVRVTLPRSHGEITAENELSDIAVAPVSRGDALGRVRWMCDGTEIASTDVCAEYDAAAVKNKKFSLWRWFLSLFGLKI